MIIKWPIWGWESSRIGNQLFGWVYHMHRSGEAMGPTQIAVRTRYIIKTQTLLAQSVTTS